MADTVYNRGKYRLLGGSGSVTWTGTSVRALLLTTTAAGAYNPDVATVTALLAVGSVAEATGTGYARKTLASPTITQDDTNDRVVLSVTNPVWTAANFGVAAALVVYDEGGGTDATRHLISYHDTGFPKTTNGGDLTVAFPATGVVLAT